jgi:hypothetical protein
MPLRAWALPLAADSSVRGGLMVSQGLSRGLASLTCSFRFHAYGFVPLVIPLKAGHALLSCKPYVIGY